ncbi:MAG TPA: cupin domain-containing protein [Burkholderiales bacterium]
MRSIFSRPSSATHTRALALGAMMTLGAGAAAGAEEGWRLIMTGHDAIATPGLQWSDAKSVPPGAKTVMLYGDPSKPGPYVFRVMFPAGYKLPAHRHEDQRNVTVLKGSYWSGVGERFAQDKLKKFGPRDFYITEARVPHFAWAETEVVIQEMGIGPVSDPIEYVNAADDPRK